MTATYPARTDEAYRGVVYGYDVVDHICGEIVHDDYVGQTRQRGKLRELQHRDRQPFSDRIVGGAHVLWEGICTDQELDEMERHFIQDVDRRPRLNEIMNEDNPHMISKAVQREQRWARDGALCRPRWVPYKQRTRESLLEWNTPDRPAYDRASPVRQRPAALTRAQKFAIGWGISWLGSTITVWLLALLWHLGSVGQTGIGSVLFLPALLVTVWLLLLWNAGKRRRRKVWRFLTGRTR